MKLSRRDFLRQSGLLALFSALPKAVTTGVDAVTVGIDAAKEHVLKVYRKTCTVHVDVPRFDVQTGVPVIDLWLAVDHPRQRLACTCEYSLDGKCLHACEEGQRLADTVADRGADLWAAIAEHVKRSDRGDIHRAWRVYRLAAKDYRKHYCTGWVQEEGDDAV